MATKHACEKLHRTWRKFRAARRGNVTLTFALSLIPVVGLVGAAVDYSRANSARTQMQAALDSTALMLSKEAASLTPAQMTQRATDYFNAMFTRPEALNKQLAVTYNAAGSSLSLSASATVNTVMARVIGKNSMAIGTSATVKWGNDRLRVALVLDNTGSMASAGKITALKTATKSLLTTLKTAATVNGDVYVSIIPFSKDVNVGASNYNANWIDWSDWDDDNGHDASTQTCTTSRSGRSGRTTRRCSTTTTWVPDNHNTWNGCITDRDQNYDQAVTPANPNEGTLPVGTPSTKFPAEQYDNCPLRMMGLNYDWTAMNTLVDAMYPNGTTNQPIGLVWGWMSLVGGGPLTAPAKDVGYTYQQIIILLSDGLNTQNRWDGNGSSVAPQVDARMLHPNDKTGTCKNIKDAGITIYTVHVNTDGDPTSTLLQNCASKPEKFFMLTSANQIVTTFNQIAADITKLRIAR